MHFSFEKEDGQRTRETPYKQEESLNTIARELLTNTAKAQITNNSSKQVVTTSLSREGIFSEGLSPMDPLAQKCVQISHDAAIQSKLSVALSDNTTINTSHYPMVGEQENGRGGPLGAQMQAMGTLDKTIGQAQSILVP